jgi:hypothetical protein
MTVIYNDKITSLDIPETEVQVEATKPYGAFASACGAMVKEMRMGEWGIRAAPGHGHASARNSCCAPDGPVVAA